MNIALMVLHVILSLGIITLVLLQKGSGASAGAAFGGGGGGAGSVFGATGSANFLSKTTALFAIGFFINSLVLAYMAANRDIESSSILDALTAPAIELSVPAQSTESVGVPQADVPPAAETDSPSAADVPAADMPPPADE